MLENAYPLINKRTILYSCFFKIQQNSLETWFHSSCENFGYSLDINRPSPFNDEDLGQMSHYIYCHKKDNGKVIECEFFIRISNHRQDFEDKQRQDTYFGTGGVEQVEKTTGMSIRRYKIRRITYDNEEYRTYDEVLDEVWDRIEKWS